MVNAHRLYLQPTPDNMPGQAILVLPEEWGINSSDTIQISIQDNQSEYLQATDGTWSPAVFYWELTGFQTTNEGSQITLGPRLIDPLLGRGLINYLINIKGPFGTRRANLLIRDNTLYGSGASGQRFNSKVDTPTEGVVIPPPEALPTESTAKPQNLEDNISAQDVTDQTKQHETDPVDIKTKSNAETESKSSTDTVTDTPNETNYRQNTKKTRSQKNILWVLLVAFLIALLLLAAAWWWFTKKPNATDTAATSTETTESVLDEVESTPENIEPVPDEVVTTAEDMESAPDEAATTTEDMEIAPGEATTTTEDMEIAPDEVATTADQPIATPPTEELSPCDPSLMDTQTDLSFLQSCLATNPSSTEILAVINQAKEQEHCSVAQRLYANRSQDGDLMIANAYVKEYDPKYHQPSVCFAEPNIPTAIYWYENILSYDPNQATAKSRLEELKGE